MNGLAAGIAGTLVLNLFERLEWRVLGREPVYSPRHIAQRLVCFGAGTARLAAAKPLGEALRWTYGPTLGALLSARHRGRGVLGAGLLVGTSIYAFELLVAPAVRVTPPVSDWPPSELVSLLAHTVAFGIASVAAFRAMGAARR